MTRSERERPLLQAGAIPVLLGPYPPSLAPLHRLLPALSAAGPADLSLDRLRAHYPVLAARLDAARAADPADGNPVAAAFWARRVRDAVAAARTARAAEPPQRGRGTGPGAGSGTGPGRGS